MAMSLGVSEAFFLSVLCLEAIWKKVDVLYAMTEIPILNDKRERITSIL